MKTLVKDIRAAMKGHETAVIRIDGDYCTIDLFKRDNNRTRTTIEAKPAAMAQNGDWFLYLDQFDVFKHISPSFEVAFYFEDHSNQFQKEKGETTAALKARIVKRHKDGHLLAAFDLLLDTQTHSADNRAKYVKSF